MMLEKRNKHLIVRVTETERVRYQEFAELAGTNVSDLVLDLIENAIFDYNETGQIILRRSKIIKAKRKRDISIRNSGNLITGNISGGKNKIKQINK